MMIASAGAVTQMRLLITGAQGFVGRSLVSAAMSIAAATAQVFACDVAVSELPLTHARSRLRCERLDVRDRAACERLLKETAPTHVLHAAAVTAGTEAELTQVNVVGTENIVSAAASCSSVRRVLLLSSSAVYGIPRDRRPCDEDHPLQLDSTYARTKHHAEQLLLGWGQQTGVSTISARLGPCYGAHEAPGPFRPGVSLVGRLLHVLQTGAILRVGGVNYSRDWTDVQDASHALLSLLLAPRLQHTLYNVSGGVAISATNLIRCFMSHGARVEWVERAEAELQLSADDGRKPLVIERLCADAGFVPIWDWEQRIAAMLQSSSKPRRPAGPERLQ